jgi:hypothetical protein
LDVKVVHSATPWYQLLEALEACLPHSIPSVLLHVIGIYSVDPVAESFPPGHLTRTRQEYLATKLELRAMREEQDRLDALVLGKRRREEEARCNLPRYKQTTLKHWVVTLPGKKKQKRLRKVG